MTAALIRDLPGPTSPLWDEARTVLSLLGFSEVAIGYWELVSPPAHREAHRGLRDSRCGGCLIEAHVEAAS